MAAAPVRSRLRNGVPDLRITAPHITRIRIADSLSRVPTVHRSELTVRRNALTLRRRNREPTRPRRARHVLTPLRAADIQRRVVVPAAGARITAVVVAVPKAAEADHVAAGVARAAVEAAMAIATEAVRLALVKFPIQQLQLPGPAAPKSRLFFSVSFNASLRRPLGYTRLAATPSYVSG